MFVLLHCSAVERKKATTTTLPLPFSSCYGVALRSSTKKATAAAVAFFYLVWSYVAAQLHEEGNGSYCRLLLHGVDLQRYAAPRKRRRQLPSPSSLYCGVALQRNSTKKATTAIIAFFSLLRSYAAP
jgi:hypothetical protein